VKIKISWDGNPCHLVNIFAVVWMELCTSSVDLLNAAEGGAKLFWDVVTADI